MSRSLFLTIAGVLAMLFGVGMLAAPQSMLANMATDSEGARMVLQWMGVPLLSIGVIDLLCRNDSGSVSLRGVMIGNLVLHILGLGIDLYHQSLGFVNASGVMTGGLVHGALIVGFVYYLRKL